MLSLITNTFLILLTSNFGNTAVSPVTDYAAALRRELFANGRYDQYNSPNRQVDNETSVLQISIKLLVLHILSVDEFTGTLTTNAWFLATWNDYRLHWNDESYRGIHNLHVPDRSIWLPDLMLINAVKAMEMDNYGDANMVIYSNGDVYWSAPVTFQTTCYVDHRFYPFDEHLCVIAMRIWSLEIEHYKLNLNAFIEKQDEIELLRHFATDNPLWEITSRTELIKQIQFSCCPDVPVPSFQMELGLRRRAPLYKFVLITPGLLSAFMCLALFWLPPTSTAKINLGGLIVAIQLALLIFLGWNIPSGGKTIPAIVLFCGNTLIMSALSVVISVIVIRISNSSKETPIPERLMFITSGFWKSCLCFGSPESQVWVRFVSKVAFSGKNQGDAELLDSEHIDVDHPNDQSPTANKVDIQSDWQLIGTAIDRLCFIVYCIIITLIIIFSFS